MTMIMGKVDYEHAGMRKNLRDSLTQMGIWKKDVRVRYS